MGAACELFKFIKATSRGHEFSPAYDVERVQLEKAFDAWLAGTPAWSCPRLTGHRAIVIELA